MYKDTTYRKVILLYFYNSEFIFNINQHSDDVAALHLIH